MARHHKTIHSESNHDLQLPKQSVTKRRSQNEKKRKGKGRARWLFLALLVFSSLLIKVDTYRVDPFEDAASSHLFSLVEWEIRHLPLKWMHLMWELFPGNRPSHNERLQLIDEYLSLVKQEKKEEDRLEGIRVMGTATRFSGSASKKKAPLDEDDLNFIRMEKERLRGRAEEAIESELSAILTEQGLASLWGILIPPVDIRLGTPPTLLVASPKEEIKLIATVLLDPDLDYKERQNIENRAEQLPNVSALVDDLSGLSTYPVIVADQSTKRTILRTAGHEWLHNYWFFRSLGRNMRSSDEMYTLNETAADIAGVELGDLLFEQLGGDLEANPSRYRPGALRDPHFTRIMRETRIRTDKLLSEGKIGDAESEMKKGWWHLRLGGYGIRKLNQAYFAFRGHYADEPASVSPIGDELYELRSYYNQVGPFIKTLSSIASYEEFQNLLETVRTKHKLQRESRKTS